MKHLASLLICVLGLMMALAQPRRSTAPVGTKYALIVGISDYTDTRLTGLQFADRDAQNFYNFLKEGFIKNIDTANVKLLLNNNAGHDSLITALFIWLNNVKSKMVEGDELYIYWAGHGVIDLNGQELLCHDTQLGDISNGDLSSAIPFASLKQAARGVGFKNGVKVYLMLDACRKNIIGQVNSDEPARARQAAPGEMFMYASSCDQFSFETDMLTPGSGVFTYFLLLGLKGGADKSPHDGKVTFGELEQFLSETVGPYVAKYLSKDPQNPTSQRPDIGTNTNTNRSSVITEPGKEVTKVFRRMADSIMKEINRDNALNIKPNAYFAGRGVAYSEDSITLLYNNVISAIANNKLIAPAGESANDYYQRLKQIGPRSNLTATAKEKLFVALLSKNNTLISNYLAGKLIDVRKDVFRLAYSEDSCALTLVPGDSALMLMLEPKMKFFKARELAGSNNPGDWNQGLNIIRTAIAKSPGAAYLYHTEGILFSNKGRYFTARKYFDTALRYAPNWVYALYSQASTNFRLQEYGKSIDSCKSIIKKDSTYSRAYSLMALNYEAIADYKKSNDFRECISWNNKALAIDSGNTTAYINLGRIYSKDLKNRAINLQKSKQYFSIGAFKYADVNCLAMLGRTYFETGSAGYDSAKMYFDMVLKAQPFHISALVDYATMLYYQGFPAQADSLLWNAVKRSEYDYNLYSKYRSFRFKTVSPADADNIFSKIIAINSEDPTVFLDHSKQYENRDSLIKARAVLYQGIHAIKGSPSLNYALAELYFKNAHYPLFKDYALDSCGYYLNYVDSLVPNYSLVTYAKCQLSKLKGEYSANCDTAVITNRYVSYTGNFYEKLMASADTALNQKDYKSAMQYYLLADSVEDKFEPKLKYVRSYYLQGQVKAARSMAADLEQYISNDEDAALWKELQALIEFDNGKYTNALVLFAKAGADTTHGLEEMVCLFKLGKTKNATEKYIQALNRDPAAKQKIVDNAGLLYSNNFMQQFEKAVAEMETRVKANRSRVF